MTKGLDPFGALATAAAVRPYLLFLRIAAVTSYKVQYMINLLAIAISTSVWLL